MDDHDSATYSIDSEPDRKPISIDDVVLPTVRRSAVQIMSLSPRRQPKKPSTGCGDGSTIQITKLVIRTPPGSPKRQPKTPGIIVRSIQTFAGPGLTGAVVHGQESVAPKPNCVLVENRNVSEEPAPYRIIPIHAGQKNKTSRKEFDVRQSERESATNEFHAFLRESFKENKTPPPSSPPPVALKVLNAAQETTTVKSTKKPPPVPVVEPVKKKEKSYDPARAREFMKEQQAKRRQEKKEAPTIGGIAGGTVKSAAKNDLIKQRLETLRQSSQKLVINSVQKARRRTQSCVPAETRAKERGQMKGKDVPPSQPRSRPVAMRPTTGMRRFSSTPSLRLTNNPVKHNVANQGNDVRVPLNKPKDASVASSVLKRPSVGSQITDERSGNKSNATSGKSSNPSSASSRTISKQPSEPSLKIGILRKPESIALDDILPFSPLKVPAASLRGRGSTAGMVNAQLIVIKADDQTDEVEKELKLQVPEVSLIPLPNASHEPVTQSAESVLKRMEEQLPQDHQTQPVKSIPSWLKQSLRQPDPYPFIVAVRKKLEAVQNVREEKNHSKDVLEAGKHELELPISRCNAYLGEIERVPYIRKRPTPATQLPNRTEFDVKPVNKQPVEIAGDGSAIMTKISQCSSSNTTSEISSIKSDIAPPLPPLLCSTRIEVPNPSAGTIPAAIGDPISPLSLDRISLMKIATPASITRLSTSNDSVKFKDAPKEDESHVSRLLNVPRTLGQRPSVDPQLERSQRELEYQRLLESFNRSLTHVIEVNQQLYSALKNVPTNPSAPSLPQEVLRIRDEMTQTSLPVSNVSKAKKYGPPRPLGGSTTTASNYSDDFEHQSQSERPQTPDKKSTDTVGSSTTTASSSTTDSSSSSSSSSSASNSSSSHGSVDSNNTSSSRTSSSLTHDGHNNSPRSEAVLARQEPHGTDDERKATSNATTAQSSDFDSRSFSLSDSHNNTTNNHPPMPEEYLPSFEESLRRDQLSSDQQQQQHKSAGDRSKDNRNERQLILADGSRESTISERINRDQEVEESFSLKHVEDANDVKVNAVPQKGGSSDESMEKTVLPEKRFKDPVIFEENADATINSDLLNAMFNRTDLEVSILSTTVSETNLSYSSIGMFDQLIQNERSKEEHLVSRVQSKQKALLNRAKGQLAWLELQKQRYREKGMTDQISAVKKKQRAILLRLEKNRAELFRQMKSSTESSRSMSNNPVSLKSVDNKLSSYCSSPAATNSGSLTLRKSSSSVQRHSRTPDGMHQRQGRITGTTTMTTSNSIHIAIRGRELQPNDRLEDILLQREDELRKRKEHVHRLLEWHRKLEKDEQDLIAVEDRLLAYNTRKLESANSPRKEHTIEARVRNIEKSLRTLQSIPTAVPRRDKMNACVGNQQELLSSNGSNESNGCIKESEEEIVLTGGSKLNRLWYRLTGMKEQRYEPGRNYPITRPHLEALYEDAKRCVLEGFQRNDGHLKETLLEQSIGKHSRESGETTINTTASAEGNASLQTTVTAAQVPPEKEEEKIQADENVSEFVQPAPMKEIELPSQEEPESGVPMMENDAKCLLSSTVNSWSPNCRRSIESVEFHTMEETASQEYQSDVVDEQEAAAEIEEPAKSESYSMTFEEHSAEGIIKEVEAHETTQPLIEDMSLPPMLLTNSLSMLGEDDSESSSSCESSATVELSVPLLDGNATEEKRSSDEHEPDTMSNDGSVSIAQSLDEVSTSSCISSGTTPTTVTPTLTNEVIEEGTMPTVEEEQNKDESVTVESNDTPSASGAEYEEDVYSLKSKSVSTPPRSVASELEQRLVTLHDELEELSETFERTPLMRSPTALSGMAKRPEDHNSSEETITFEDGGDESDESPSLDEPTKAEQEDASSGDVSEGGNAAKIEVKVRTKAVLPVNDKIVSSSSNFTCNRDYPAPPQPPHSHQFHLQPEGLPPSIPSGVTVRMPDIINEAEVLRRQQLQIEQEIKELEQQVGFFREIPNKPPPPYIPPANGSPLALLFPCELRIDELIDGRVEELHRDRIAPERLGSDHVTNVYEKLILDMCNELYRDLRPADPTVSFRTIPHDKRPLVFHNPPDALYCMKDYLRQKVRRVLSEAQLALQQQQHQHQQAQLLLHHQLQQAHPTASQLHHHHLLHHHCATTVPFMFANGCANKRKPDQVDEILKQETHDDDPRWTNFDREEIEVKNRITDELLKSLLTEALQDMTEAFERKTKGRTVGAKKESAM
ncbi:uncharacterized protein LOC128723773 [Anopheles nili]|uniref:uncharacterized protein LOC128723773 n=1 Tax=Anopheles nili TaxID=185578 RepID=UPI00237BE07D|nr:uncharacterized protein LOC128723773 [Anopheles nili]